MRMLNRNTTTVQGVGLGAAGVVALVFLPNMYNITYRVVGGVWNRNQITAAKEVDAGGRQYLSKVEKSIEILRTASSAGRFMSRSHLAGREELNWTDIKNTNYQVPLQWAEDIGFSQTLVKSFHRIVHTINHEKDLTHLPQHDQELITGLQGKTLLFMGDSTDANIWATLCRCPRHGHVTISTQGTAEHDNETMCISDRGKNSECDGPKINTCHLKTLNLTLHQVEGEYTIHPYGPIPFQRGQKPECNTQLNLAYCLQKKWNATCNSYVSLKCMGDASCPTHRPPDIVFYNMNLWFWFRIGWFGKLEEVNYPSMPWQDIEESYMYNATIVLHTLTREYLRDVKVVILQTSPGTKAVGRVVMPQVMHINSVIRELASNWNSGGGFEAMPPVGLLELEHMGHMGWNREQFLRDDIHPQIAFNIAVSNILLNALAVL